MTSNPHKMKNKLVNLALPIKDRPVTTLVKGTVQSTNSPFSFSDSDLEYGSSPCNSTPPDSPLNEKALQVSDSFPNLSDFFHTAKDFDPLILPLLIDRTSGNTRSSLISEVPPALTEGYNSPEVIEPDYQNALALVSKQPEVLQEESIAEDGPIVNLEHPATLLPILIPWLAKMGLCISAIPPPKKSSIAKKKKKGIRELVNLYSDMQFSSKASSSRRLGSSSIIDSD